jgi:hypothetical protein
VILTERERVRRGEGGEAARALTNNGMFDERQAQELHGVVNHRQHLRDVDIASAVEEHGRILEVL